MPKPSPRPGEVWVIDAGYVAKIRPCLLLTGPPADDELDLVTVISIRPRCAEILGNYKSLNPFCDRAHSISRRSTLRQYRD